MEGIWIKTVTLYLCVLSVAQTSLSQTVIDGFNNLQKEKKLNSHLIGVIYRISVLDCVEECLARKRCKSVNYIRRFLACEMNYDSTTTPDSETGSVYTDVDAFPRGMIGQCKENNCSINSMCVRKAMGDFRCEISDCGIPYIQAGKMFHDKISTGTRGEYVCNFDKHDAYKNPMFCDIDGIWKLDLELTETSCLDYLQKNPHSQNGYYVIRIDRLCSMVYCDMEGGGWTVIQQRIDGSTNFNRSWIEYKEGFGDIETNFWLGNDMIAALSSDNDTELRIDLWKNETYKYEQYDSFYILDENSGYKLKFSGANGTAGEAFQQAKDKKFTTFDRDNDAAPSTNCASKYGSGWWFVKCHGSDLNGEYGNDNYGFGINWITFDPPKALNFSLTKSTMKIRKRSN